MNPKTRRRLFVGMLLSRRARSRLQCDGVTLDGTPCQRSLKWVLGDPLHLTLKFLGEVGEAHVGSLSQGLSENFLAWGWDALPKPPEFASGGCQGGGWWATTASGRICGVLG